MNTGTIGVGIALVILAAFVFIGIRTGWIK
jgi:hypothetical protein